MPSACLHSCMCRRWHTRKQPLPARHRSHRPRIKGREAQLGSLRCGLCAVRPHPGWARLRTVKGSNGLWLALVRLAPARPARAFAA
jgi:hypothetical protein